MKLVAGIVPAFALVAFASPALACGDKQHTTASSSTSSSSKETVAKKGDKAAKGAAKTATVQN